MHARRQKIRSFAPSGKRILGLIYESMDEEQETLLHESFGSQRSSHLIFVTVRVIKDSGIDN